MPFAWPAWLVMWTLAGGVYAACKLVTWHAAADAGRGATWWRHAGYLLAWPGMDAPAFLAKTSVWRPTRREWGAAAGKTALGAALVFAVVPAARRLPRVARRTTADGMPRSAGGAPAPASRASR